MSLYHNSESGMPTQDLGAFHHVRQKKAPIFFKMTPTIESVQDFFVRAGHETTYASRFFLIKVDLLIQYC